MLSVRRISLCQGALFVALVAAMTFGSVVGFGFAYDDEWTIVGNQALDRGLAPLLRASFTGAARAANVPDATRPLMIASTWLDRSLFGLEPAGYHAHSLLLYVACSVAAFFAAFGIARRRTTAFVAGLLFAVAPVHAEVVAAINYREDLLSSLAVLGVFAWIARPARARDTVDAAAVAGGVFALGLLAKASALALLPLVVVWWFVLSRSPSARRARLPTLAALAIVAAAWGSWRGWLRWTGRDDVPAAPQTTALARLLDTARYEVRVFFDAVWPWSWAPDHPPEPSASPMWLVALGACVVILVGVMRYRRLRVAGFAAAWVLITPLVTAPLVGPVNPWADRYLFVPVLGGACLWAAALGALGRTARQHMPGRRAGLVLGLVSAVIVGMFALEARSAAAIWESNATLWRAAVEREPASARAWTALSRQLRHEGDLEGADLAVSRAISLDPGLLLARVTAIYNALARGDLAQARVRIDEIERMGGHRQLGMRRARHCVTLGPREAAACAGAPKK